MIQHGQLDPDVADEVYQSDEEAHDDVLTAVLRHITLISRVTSTVHTPAFVSSCVSSRMKYSGMIILVFAKIMQTKT